MQYRFIQALKRLPVDRTPIWLMRQAGRYLPEYRAIRAQAGSFMALCKNPELACMVTLQPLQRFDLDAAIIFSDILTVPDAMGLGLHFIADEGPHFKYPVRDLTSINHLPIIVPETELGYVMAAIRLVKAELVGKVPLIGFAGSPWTVATYMVEGKSSKNFNIIKRMLYAQPASLQKLLEIVAKNTAAYLHAQISAGADAVMLFDTWGGVLPPTLYNKFSLPYIQYIVNYLRKTAAHIPIILFCKDSGRSLSVLSNTGAAAIAVDWTVDLQQAMQQVGNKVALQGNLDPGVLYGSRQLIKQEVARILAAVAAGAAGIAVTNRTAGLSGTTVAVTEVSQLHGYVFNLGHGIPPDVEPQQIEFLVEEVKYQSTHDL